MKYRSNRRKNRKSNSRKKNTARNKSKAKSHNISKYGEYGILAYYDKNQPLFKAMLYDAGDSYEFKDNDTTNEIMHPINGLKIITMQVGTDDFKKCYIDAHVKASSEQIVKKWLKLGGDYKKVEIKNIE